MTVAHQTPSGHPATAAGPATPICSMPGCWNSSASRKSSSGSSDFPLLWRWVSELPSATSPRTSTPVAIVAGHGAQDALILLKASPRGSSLRADIV